MPLPDVQRFEIDGPLQITPRRFGDDRGFFSEVYNKQAFVEIGVACEFVQDNHSLSVERGTVRGLHFQIAPFAQAKLVRVVRGSIYDVAVDIRKSSPTYGKSVGVTLSARNWQQLFVPKGFAHGFCTLEPDTEVLYKVDAPYSRDHERGLLWNDPALSIAWPVEAQAAILIARDRENPPLSGLAAFF
jgi:dTDP-4-dehydrorhamnose 3,5-epimerase